MNIHFSDRNERLGAAQLKRLATATATVTVTATATAADAHETPTVVPPPDESRPTVRWTPPPALLSRADKRRR